MQQCGRYLMKPCGFLRPLPAECSNLSMMSIKTGLHEQEWNPVVLQKHLLKAEIFCPLDKIEKARRNIAKRKILEEC